MQMDEGKPGAEESRRANKKVTKSKRRRLQDDDDAVSHVDSGVKEQLAKQLSDYLDRTIEEVVICERDDEKRSISEEKQADDFQLFSNSGKTASETFSEEMQDDGKASAPSLSSDDDDEATERLKEAAISVEDIFGSKFS